MKKMISFNLFLILSLSIYCQENKSALYVQFNTVFIYSNYTVNYESKTFLKQIEKHDLKLSFGIGGWSTSAFNRNSGAILNYGITYNYGVKAHLLDIAITYQNHFDSGLKGQPIVFVGSTLRPTVGYRYQPIDGKILFKIGTGWREVLQVGFGYRF